MSLMTIVNSNRQLERPKLIQIFIFRFGEYVICLYDEFKLEWKTDYEKKKIKSSKNNVKNLKNTVNCILWFYNKLPDKKPEDPTDILECKVSLLLMKNKAIYQLLTR